MDLAAISARDLFEAGLNEAACCWPRPMGVRDERRRFDSGLFAALASEA